MDNIYDLAGAIPSTAFTLNPDSVQDLKLIVAPKNPRGLLITVKDASTNLPLSGASVHLTGTGYDNTMTTGRGYIRQTDWVGGAGQDNYVNGTKYSDSDGNTEIADPAGELHLKKVLAEYASSSWLVSSTFDTGSASNFNQILWQPQDQPPEVGGDGVRFQIATNNDKTTWNFLGPDGTGNTYYTVSNQNINSLHNNDRYSRYKFFLQTNNSAKSPSVSDISFTFTSACVPPGQVFFSGLKNSSYNVSISKTGYATYSGTSNTSSPWQQSEITLTP
jgi:hypothetical protein